MEPEVERRLTEEARSDPEAFGVLYDEFMPVVYGYIYRRVMKREVAEDLTSQTFEKALKSIGRLRKGASFKVWLYRIAGNTIIDYYRFRGRRSESSLDEAGDFANGHSGKAVEAVENRVSVMRLLEELPENHRLALVLHFLEGLTMEQMAQVLDTSPSACYMRVYRATRALSDLIEKMGITSLEDYVVQEAEG